MESSLVSWQIENFSSAELINSPPISPAPTSPSIYNAALLPPMSPPPKESEEEKKLRALSSRAHAASTILKDLEQQAVFKMEANDFGMNWDEESVNLNLFEELAEIEYTPPASPKRSLNFTTEESRNVILTPVNLISTPASAQFLPEQPIHHLNGQASHSSTDITALTAEFQAILDSLPKDGDNTEALSHVLEIAGIRTTIIDGEALVPVELDLAAITHPDLQDFEMELDDIDVNSVISGNDEDLIEESELYAMSDMSNQGSPTSSVHSVYEYAEEVDEHSQAAEKILDALLLGDVATAEAFLPVIVENEDSSFMGSEDSFQSEHHHGASSSSSSSFVTNKNKPERRGRKPGKKLAKGSSGYVKDKTLRKKEQNKTAATRYRQKKKIEFAVIMENEDQLQKEHDDLEQQKKDLSKQIAMVKQLLRDVIQSKKPVTTAEKPIVSRGTGTTSGKIGRNRRK